MSARVRRGVYHRRCRRCFWEGTYDTAAKADHAKRRHSCVKRELAMLRHSQAQARDALIDRIPKPCTHKRADHQCGTRAKYVFDRCRCKPCSKANSEAETWRERQKAYGRYNKYVPAEFVRDHLAELQAYGIGLKHVSTLSGVSNGSLTKIWYGTYATTGRGHERRHGEGELVRGPARRVLRRTAEAIYAIEPVPENLPPLRPDPERTSAARLHLRALVALGWSQSKLARRLGMKPGNFTRTITGDRPMRRQTVDQVEALFAALSMTLPPETGHRERIAASRARRRARELGWLPPLALDDEHAAEDPYVETDAVDEVAIQRRIGGDRSVRLTKAESVELVRRWRASTRPLNECERVTGLNPQRYHQPQEASA